MAHEVCLSCASENHACSVSNRIEQDRTHTVLCSAGVPGMVGGMLRHMRSLRSMRRDNGWIHTLLEEAENERMHLLTFLQLRQPGLLFRGMVLLSQVWAPPRVLSLLGYTMTCCMLMLCQVWAPPSFIQPSLDIQGMVTC